MPFRYSPDYGRVWAQLTPQERDEIESMKAFILTHPFDPQLRPWHTDQVGRDWFYHQSVHFILVFRIEGKTVSLAQIVAHMRSV